MNKSRFNNSAVNILSSKCDKKAMKEHLLSITLYFRDIQDDIHSLFH